MIGKEQLVYDPTELGDTTGSHTLDGSGNQITSTVDGAKRGLDVNLISEFDVTIDGDYDGVTNLNPSSAGLIAHDRGASPDITAQNQRPTGGAASADALVAANVHCLDTNGMLHGFNGTTWDRMLSYNKILRNADVRDGALVSTAKSVTDVTGVILASEQAARGTLIFQNHDTKNCWFGASGVSKTTGIRLSAGAIAELNFGESVSVHAVTDTGKTVDMRILEAAF